VKQHFVFLPLILLAAAPSIAQPAARKPARTACGPLAGQLFQCPKFGFRYKVILGWVDRTDEMQASDTNDHNDESRDAGTESSSKPPASASRPAAGMTARETAKSETLLAVFERPPGAAGETVDSAVVIALESRQEYPQIKTAADYFGPISDVAAQRGFKAESDPYSFSIGSKQLVREDFNGERGKLPIFQTSLVTLEKGRIVSFTFLAGSEDEIDALIENLSFVPNLSPRPSRQ
jgi:hypothetical protein